MVPDQPYWDKLHTEDVSFLQHAAAFLIKQNHYVSDIQY